MNILSFFGSAGQGRQGDSGERHFCLCWLHSKNTKHERNRKGGQMVQYWLFRGSGIEAITQNKNGGILVRGGCFMRERRKPLKFMLEKSNEQCSMLNSSICYTIFLGSERQKLQNNLTRHTFRRPKSWWANACCETTVHIPSL